MFNNLHVQHWKLECRNNHLESTYISPSRLQVIIKEQVSKFPAGSNFDYSVDEAKLDNYYSADLVKFVDTVTVSDWSKSGHKHSELYSDMRKIRIKALLCFTMNPTRCFIQTLLGLVYHSFGMGDGSFDILNTCGVTCSVDHIRRHGQFWSNQCSAIDELDKSKFWRLTIDNLDFKIKYAKNIGNTALNGVKKC